MAPVKRDSHSGIWFATFNTTDKVGELRGCYVVTFLFSGETNWTLFFFFIGSVGLLNLTHFDNCPSIRISHVGARPDWDAYVGRCFNVKSKFVPEFPMPTQTYFVLRRRLLHSHAHPKYSDDVGTGAELKKKRLNESGTHVRYQRDGRGAGQYRTAASSFFIFFFRRYWIHSTFTHRHAYDTERLGILN